MFHFTGFKYKICTTWKLFLPEIALLCIVSSLHAQAATTITVNHTHAGNSTSGGGCYTRQEKHRHQGSKTAAGGCYTEPVYHEHSGSSVSGGGCYLAAVEHAHNGNSTLGYGCYTNPIYHEHSGSSTSGGDCYQIAVCHEHRGSSESEGGCYGTFVYHGHSGNSTSGGGCYATPIYHEHSGSSESGEGCYTIPVYHHHAGNSTLGGECYGTPVYHRHKGQPGKTYANGCYTLETTEEIDVFCGLFEEQENGIWQCNQCGELTVDSNVPYNRHHSPTTMKTVYALECGKSESTPERYELSCSKSAGTIESYTLGCGKDITTVESYALNCGKDESTVESYALNCGKNESAIESYNLSCGRDVNTVENYALGCGKAEGQVEYYVLSCQKTAGEVEYYVPGCGKDEGKAETFLLSCGMSQKTALGTLEISQEGDELLVKAEGIAVTGCLWSDGSREERLANVMPDSEYTCLVSYLDHGHEQQTELRVRTEAAPIVKEEVVQPVKVEMESFAKEEEPAESTESIRQPVVYLPVSQEGPWESWMFVAGAVAVILVAVLVGVYFLWSKIALLYCYDTNREYKLLGILAVHKNQQNYKVRIERRIWTRASVNRYRLALNRRLQKKAMDLPLVIETEEQNLVLPLEEFVDFAL